MRALLTGATGFVGQNLQRHLLAKGWQIESISRADSPSDMDRKMAEFKPDLVIHLATLFIAEHKAEEIPGLIQSNVTFGTQVVDSMVRHGVKHFLNTGTLWQYFGGDREVPSSLYAATKTAFESILKFYVSAHQLKAMTLMLSDTYGPKDPRAKLLPKLLSMAGTDQRLQMSPGEQKVDWTFITDIVEAFEVASIRLISGHETQNFAKYTVTSGELLSLKDSVAVCEKVLGKKIQIEFGARPYRQREIMEPSRLDPQLPGWAPKFNLERGIEACLHG
jgi:nucleoside-diphosphate-sugar epimerase